MAKCAAEILEILIWLNFDKSMEIRDKILTIPLLIIS